MWNNYVIFIKIWKYKKYKKFKFMKDLIADSNFMSKER